MRGVNWLPVNSSHKQPVMRKAHDRVIKWKHFPRYWTFVRGIRRSSVNSPHKGQLRGVLMFSLICAWLNNWVNNREAGDLRRHRVHYDIIVMVFISCRGKIRSLRRSAVEPMWYQQWANRPCSLFDVTVTNLCCWKMNHGKVTKTFSLRSVKCKVINQLKYPGFHTVNVVAAFRTWCNRRVWRTPVL